MVMPNRRPIGNDQLNGSRIAPTRGSGGYIETLLMKSYHCRHGHAIFPVPGTGLNPKLEYRNPKQIRISKQKMSSVQCPTDFLLSLSNLFRISGFGYRIVGAIMSRRIIHQG